MYEIALVVFSVFTCDILLSTHFNDLNTHRKTNVITEYFFNQSS